MPIGTGEMLLAVLGLGFVGWSVWAVRKLRRGR